MSGRRTSVGSLTLDDLYARLRTEAFENLPILALLGVLVLGFRGLIELIFRIADPLPREAYEGVSILLGALQFEASFVLFALPIGVLALCRRQLRWDTFEFGRELRLIAMMCALPLVWEVVAMDYNFYFQQAYHIDRLLVLFFFAALWYHPIFAFPLALGIYMIQGQLMYPIGTISDTNQKLPRQALVLFSAFLFLRIRLYPPVRRTLDETPLRRVVETEAPDEYLFIWALGALIAISYVIPGVGKALLLYPQREIVAYHLPWAYIRGWLWQLDTATIELAFDYLAAANPLLTWGALAVEVGMIAFVWRRRVMNAFVVVVIGFQLLIFALSGILFKKWFFVLVGFAWAVTKIDTKLPDTFFDRRTQVVVTGLVILVVVVPVLFPVTHLFWYTSTYDRTYTMEAVDSDGDVYELGWGSMGPYELLFRQNRVQYLDKGKSLSGQGARTTRDWQRLQIMRNATTPDELRRVRAEYGTVQYDRQRARAFDGLVRRYFESQVCEQRSVVWSTIPSLSHQFWGKPGDRLPSNADYERVRIRKTGYLYTDGNIQRVDSTIVRNITVSGC